MRRLSRSPFLYLALVVLLVGSLSGFLLNKNKNSFLLVKNVLDSSQYLFFANGKPSEQILFAMIGGTTLQPLAPPALFQGRTLASLEEVDYEFSQTRKEIELYIVQKGETVSSIAQKFGISGETVFWANDLTNKSILKVGQELVILPVSGAMHIVKNAETLSGIAKLYQVKVKDIVDFNELTDDDNIKAGDFLVIPGGLKPKAVSQYNPVPLPNSYFICPIPSPCVISQGLHWFNAVDFNNNRCGDPVFAAAGGEVQRVGFTQVGGNYVRVLHNNGVVTYYGHLSGTAVKVGQKVDQGQVLGYVGHTGQTAPAGEAGCHLHFDVRFGANPFAKYPVGAKLGR